MSILILIRLLFCVKCLKRFLMQNCHSVIKIKIWESYLKIMESWKSAGYSVIIVADAQILYDKNSGKSRGMGIVRFKREESFTRALEKMNEFVDNRWCYNVQELEGRRLSVRKYESFSKRFFVCSLKSELLKVELRNKVQVPLVFTSPLAQLGKPYSSYRIKPILEGSTLSSIPFLYPFEIPIMNIIEKLR